MKYPTWICASCGAKYGRGWPKDHVATFHEGVCDICKQEDSVTEPRDFGHLRDGWDAKPPAVKEANRG